MENNGPGGVASKLETICLAKKLWPNYEGPSCKKDNKTKKWKKCEKQKVAPRFEPRT